MYDLVRVRNTCNNFRFDFCDKSQTYVESFLVFVVNDKSNFVDSCVRIGGTEFVCLVEERVDDEVAWKAENSSSHGWNGNRIQTTLLRLDETVPDEFA